MMLAVAVAVPTSAGAAGQGESASVTGGGKGLFKSSVYRDVTEDGRKVRATAIPVQFDLVDDKLYADVLVRGVATGNGEAPERESVLVEDVPVHVNAVAGGSGGPGMVGTSSHGCDILNLELGEIHLDLLGLVIDLSQINLDIVAEPGAGNLLGNLLCAVAGLLDPASPLEELLGQVNALLDQLLGGLLGGLSL
jgi:hypothetical protein